ncbi:MAG: class I SAM-dependent methyltransferase [Candidatus Pacearchaeota archaeon]
MKIVKNIRNNVMSLYSEDYANKYRISDEDIKNHESYNSLRDVLTGYFLKKSENAKIEVLDIGCGTGRYFHLFNGDKIKRFVGIDISPHMLKIAMENPPFKDKINIKNIELICDDFLEIKNIGKFDFVYSIGVLGEHTFLNKRVVRHILEYYLKSGSIFIFTTVCWWYRSWKRRIINNFLKIFNLEKYGKNFFNYDRELYEYFFDEFEILEFKIWNKEYPHYLMVVKRK